MTCVKMLADYEVRFDCLEKGLWLQAHFYDADPRFKEDLDDGVVPVGRSPWDGASSSRRKLS